MRSIEKSIRPASGMRPKAKPHHAGRRGRDGQDDLREGDLLDQPVLRRDGRRRVHDRRREPLPRQDGREDEERVVLDAVAARDERDEDDVHDHLEQRVEDPPEVAQERVGATLAHVRDHQVADQSTSRPDVVDALANQSDRTRITGRVPVRGRYFTRGGHRAEGYHFGRPGPRLGLPRPDPGIARRSARWRGPRRFARWRSMNASQAASSTVAVRTASATPAVSATCVPIISVR